MNTAEALKALDEMDAQLIHAKRRVFREIADAMRSQQACLLAREKSLKEEGDRWVKAKTECDQWKANAEDFAIRVAEFVNDWSKGDFALPTLAAHDAEALKRPLEVFAKLISPVAHQRLVMPPVKLEAFIRNPKTVMKGL